MMKIKVAVMAGGYSSEADVSRRSAVQVCSSLDRALFDPHIVEINHSEWICEGREVNRADFSVEGIGQFNYALIMIHGTPGENGPLQGYLEMLGIPHSTSSAGVMAITFDKKLCKAALCGLKGVNLAKDITLSLGEEYSVEQIVAHLELPLFVKPTQSGSSFGVSKVYDSSELGRAIELAREQNSEVICEEFIEGVEVSQGVMVCGDETFILPITELVTDNDFFDYEAKYTPGLTSEITPARISHEVADKISQCTLAIYKSLDCRGVVRIDYIIRDGVPYFIEVNGVPGMSAQSIIPQQWAEIGLTIGEAFEKIIFSSLSSSDE